MKWNYKTVAVEVAGGQWWVGGKPEPAAIDAMLNEMGSQEWELVAVMDTNQSGGATRFMVYTFKRPQK
jgi:hypothetical protein